MLITPADSFGRRDAALRIKEAARQVQPRAAERERITAAYASLSTTDVTSLANIPHTPAMDQLADDMGLDAVTVIAFEPGETEGVGFRMLTAFLPPVGSFLGLPDGRVCEVKRVQFGVGPTGAAGMGLEALVGVANVIAEVEGGGG
jgi:hypothetical protein